MHDFGPQELAACARCGADRRRFRLRRLPTSRPGAASPSSPGCSSRSRTTRPAPTTRSSRSARPGDLIGRYRKQHLFDALGWRESERLVEGETGDRLVFDCGEFRVGVLTCYDIRFPELTRALVDDGATLLAVPTAWVAGPLKAQQFRTLATARAIENVCYLAAAVQSPPSYTGRERASSIRSARSSPSSATPTAWRSARASAQRVSSAASACRRSDHRRWQVSPEVARHRR